MMIKRITCTSLLLLALAPLTAKADVTKLDIDADTVLLKRGDVTITEYDLKHYIRERVPTEHQAQALAQPNAIRQMLENLFVIRWLATEAERVMPIDSEHMDWQAQLFRERTVMNHYLNAIVEEELERIDWDETIKDIYIADQDEFVSDERVDAAHILIDTESRTPEDARALAESLLERLKKGESFDELARAYTDDPNGRNTGGQLGQFPRGQMVPAFERAAFALRNPGDLSGVVETQFGYHIIKLNTYIPAGPMSLEHARPIIESSLHDTLRRRIREGVLIETRSSTDIEVEETHIESFEQRLRGTFE